MTVVAGAAGLVAVGDELVAGDRAEGNLGWLARELSLRGWRVVETRVVGDDEERLAEAFKQLLAGCELVVATGGLGPTLDDITRHAAATACALDLEEDADTLERLESFWRERGAQMPEANRRQALIPLGAESLENAYGTAPGFLVEAGPCRLACLPGPPREMRGVATDALFARVSRGTAPKVRRLFLFDLSESRLADLVGKWMERDADPRMGVLASGGVLELKFSACGTTEEDVARVKARFAEASERLDAWVFSEEQGDLARVLVDELLTDDCSVAVAESCTGGQVSERMCGIPGVSAVLREALVTYSNEAKSERLGVPSELIAAHGVVSDEVADAMARGLAETSGARLVGAVTGIAGPGGGTEAKPVGRVHFAVGLDGVVQTHSRTFAARGRSHVQAWATNTLLHLMLSALREGG